MPKKVNELAQEYQIEAKALLNHLRELGIFVSSHMSLLDDEEVEKVRATIAYVHKRQEVTEKRVRPTVIRRRVVKAPPPEEEKAPEPAPVEVPPVQEAAPPVQQEAAETPEPAMVEEPKPKRPSRAKKEKPSEAAIVIRRPAVRPQAEAPSVSPVEAQRAEEVPVPPPQPLTTQAPEESESASVEEGAIVSPQPLVERVEKAEEAPAKPVRGKKAKVVKDFMEPAKIVKRAKPDVIRRIMPTPEMPPPKVTELPLVPSPELAEDRARPKKRKSLKAFEVITQEKAVRGKVGKKKEVIQLREELEERERGFRIGPRKKKLREAKKTEFTVPKAAKRRIRIAESIVVADLAKRIGVKARDLILKLLELGVTANINQLLDPDEASVVASEFGYEVEKVVTRAEELLRGVQVQEAQENLKVRPPVVTVMGHVDHGKTSLLDAIRQTRVTDQEVGGITQHIGAYQVEVQGRTITFLDTPGHEAFTSLRARGAQVTDVVVLVVAADDGVMNQTKEAIDHARAAKVPIIVAINKIDKPNAEVERVKNELAGLGLVPEAWGGDTIVCEVSAKQRIGIEELLENILLQADVLELRANPDRPARGTVIEAKLDKRRGPVATILVQEGTLKLNDAFVAGMYSGKVRTMLDHLGRRVEEAGPSTPVEVIGASGVPLAGEKLIVVADEKEARDIEEFRRQRMRREEMVQTSRASLDLLLGQRERGEVKELPVVIKADVQGSVETLKDILTRLGGDKVKVQVIHASVGGITENDVNLASASNALIIGFNVRPEPRAQAMAEEMGVEVRIYNIIYELIEAMEKALVGMLEPVRKENVLGRGEVVQLFKISKVGTVAGTLVKDGRIPRGARARLVRDGVQVYDGKIATLRRYQDDVKEVLEGQDCGIHLENFDDVKVGDLVEVYELEELPAELR